MVELLMIMHCLLILVVCLCGLSGIVWVWVWNCGFTCLIWMCLLGCFEFYYCSNLEVCVA